MEKDIINFHDTTEDATKTHQPTKCLRIATGFYSIMSLLFLVDILIVEITILILFQKSGRYGGSSIFMAVVTCFTGCLAVASILGIVGAFLSNRKIIIWFVSFSIVFLAAEAAIIIVLLAKPDFAFPYAEELFQNYIDRANEGGNNDTFQVSLMSSMRKLQTELKCCGFDGPEDFTYAILSCCQLDTYCKLERLKGCNDKILAVVELLSRTIDGLDLIILTIQIVFVTCTVILIKRL
ncbi:unnamed protein product [Rodentolepis nana]|uniref:Tetraspanin n=1 Tax=Rodentolepis nana TaxID=102285 RepID=A0A0R3TYS4_RODNA|nr:unnamed protein product [Rodentolepis nana]